MQLILQHCWRTSWITAFSFIALKLLNLKKIDCISSTFRLQKQKKVVVRATKLLIATCDSQPNNSHSNHTYYWMCYNTGAQRYFHPWRFPLPDDCALWTIVFLKNFKGKKEVWEKCAPQKTHWKVYRGFSIRKVHPIKKIVRLYLLKAHTLPKQQIN